jgi:chromosome segregation ATPase
VRYTGGANPFEKIKGLIMGMIEKLEAEAEADAEKKGYCDKEMSETEAKKVEKEAEIEKLSTKIDEMSTSSKKLQEEVAVLQKELAELAKAQATMDAIRAKEKEDYTASKAELEQGIAGLQLALKVLRDYYAKGDASASSEAGSGIISMLEVAESDCTKNLQEIESTESTAAAAYEKETKENDITKTTKSQDAKYKTKEAKGLDEGVSESSADRSSVQAELDAVLEYYTKIKEKCVAKVDSYEQIVARREAEISGLKEALEILESEAALIQKSTKRVTLRGKRA